MARWFSLARSSTWVLPRCQKGRVKIVKVLYFAEVKEILNMSNEYIDILEPKTVKEIRQLLNQYHPELMDKKFQIAVNEEFTKEDGIVQPDDIIALIPPVSGG